MPVWHEVTKAARAAGDLHVVGIVQEQHAERARLFARWQGIDWPLLHDPFNLTGSKVVPRVFLIDASGIVRAIGANPRTFKRTFLDVEFPGRPASRLLAPNARHVVQQDGPDVSSPEPAAWQAISDLLWGRIPGLVEGTRALAALDAMPAKDAVWAFRRGVARRLLLDAGHEAVTFQSAVDAWQGALALDPRQYIWRRRIQQYGPRLDKPYPFYGWVSKACADLEARGERPIALTVPLSQTERLGRGPATAPTDPMERSEADALPALPTTDADVTITRVPHTAAGKTRWRIHVRIRAAARAAGEAAFTLDPEAPTPLMWWGADPVAGVVRPDGSALAYEVEAASTSIPDGALAAFGICRTTDGTCEMVRLPLSD